MNEIFERSLNRIYGVPEKGIYLFAESSYKFENKAVSIIGNGTGKTTIMRAVTIFERYCNLAFTAPTYQLENYKQILTQTPDYVNCSHTSDTVRTTGLFPPECFYKNMLFDEVGKESKLIKHFGNDINFFTFIVEKRYRIVQDKGLSFSTNFTSNLPPEALIKHYGTHVFDRLTEMVDFVELQGQSKRR